MTEKMEQSNTAASYPAVEYSPWEFTGIATPVKHLMSLTDASRIYALPQGCAPPLVVAAFLARRPCLYGICVDGIASKIRIRSGSFRYWRVLQGKPAPEQKNEFADDLRSYLKEHAPDYVAYRRLHCARQTRAFPEARRALQVLRKISPAPCVSVNPCKAGKVQKAYSIVVVASPPEIARKLVAMAAVVLQGHAGEIC